MRAANPALSGGQSPPAVLRPPVRAALPIVNAGPIRFAVGVPSIAGAWRPVLLQVVGCLAGTIASHGRIANASHSLLLDAFAAEQALERTTNHGSSMRPATYDAHATERMQGLDGRELASFTARASAFVIDFAIAGLLFMLLFSLVGLPITRALLDAGVLRPQGNVLLQVNFFQNWYSVVWLVLYFGLTTYFGHGRTPGKRLMRIRVVSLAHDHLGLWHSIERALGYGASALEFGFGFAQYFLHPNRRTVHDRIAETIVVTDRPGRRSGAGGAPEGGPEMLAGTSAATVAGQREELTPPAV